MDNFQTRIDLLGRICICGCGKTISETKRLGTGFYDTACKSRDYRRKRNAGMIKIMDGEVLNAMLSDKITENTCKQCGNTEAIVGKLQRGRLPHTCTICAYVMMVRP